MDLTPEELERIEILGRINSKRRNRTLIGAVLISLSLILMQIATMILLGMINAGSGVALLLVIASPLALAAGLYLLLHMPPVVTE